MAKQVKKPRKRTSKDIFIVVHITIGNQERTIRSANPNYVAREMNKL